MITDDLQLGYAVRGFLEKEASSRYRDPQDYDGLRTSIFDRTMSAVGDSFPVENSRYRLEVSDLQWKGPDRVKKRAVKRALQKGQDLSRPLTGIMTVVDKATGKPVSKSHRRTLINMPYLTETGTYVRGGVTYAVPYQLRMVEGVFPHWTSNDLPEAQFNVQARTGYPFRVLFEPEKALYSLRIRGRKVPLYPVLRAMGVDDDTIKQAWGKDIHKANATTRIHPYALQWIKQATAEGRERLDKNIQKEAAEQGVLPDASALQYYFGRMRLDGPAVQRSLGKPYDRVSPESILAASSYLKGMSRQEKEPVSRDGLEYQRIVDFGDHMAEKIRNDQNGVMRGILWNITNKQGSLDKVPTAPLDKHVQHFFNMAGLAQAVEEVNPIELYNQNQRIVRMGEGALSSIEAAPDEARNVMPSYMGYIDAVRSPESIRVGLDMYLARGAKKGNDGQLYTPFVNLKTGRVEHINATQAADSVIAFPGTDLTKRFAPAMYKGQGIRIVPSNSVQYVLRSGDDLFSKGSDTVPLKSGVKGMRLLMGAKFGTHAVPLKNREAPLVDTVGVSGKSTSEELGTYAGAIRSDTAGLVEQITDDSIILQTPEGRKEVELYNNHPFARKTYGHSTPSVHVGQTIKKGDLLATSNYTDDKGRAALGINASVAYFPYEGLPYEDAVVVSQKFADNLTSQHMYSTSAEPRDGVSYSKKQYRTLFPTVYDKQQLSQIGDDGIIKPGSTVNYGDPLVLAIKEQEASVRSMGRRMRTDESSKWEHQSPGTVTDVVNGKRGVSVFVKTEAPLQIADKLALPWGTKGVVAEIVPSDEMVQDANGDPVDLIVSQLSLPSRTNPAQAVAAALGKVAHKTGKRYVLPGFMDEDMIEFAQQELQKVGLSDTEDLFNPKSNRTIPKVFVGRTYVYKPQQMAESKGKSRATGGYTWEDTPARGGGSGGKHVGDMEYHALIAHGAGEVIRDLKLIRGQRNDDFWRQVKLGQTPSVPDTPLVYDKFRALMAGAHVRLNENRTGDSIFAMTNKQAKEITGTRRIETGRTFDMKMRPIAKGLFDKDLTNSGGSGDRFAYIALPEPLINPVMYEPIRTLLGVTQKDMDTIISGDGDRTLEHMVKHINLQSIADRAKQDAVSASKSKRSDALKRYGYARAMLKQGVRPSDFLMDRVVVVPPRYRPIMKQGDLTMVSDLNHMYKGLVSAVDDFKEARMLAPDLVPEARKSVYNAFSALVGLSKPTDPKLQQQRVGGVLQQMLGKGSPKYSLVQRRILGSDADLTGLGVAIPDPTLKLNEIGIPEEKAWTLFRPYIIRHMIRSGMSASAALKSLKTRSDAAKDALLHAAADRVVLVNRAPSLHKYSIMAFNARIVPGEAVRTSPLISKPMGLDHDGDVLSYMVPASRAAVDEARQKMMPEQNLISMRTGKPHYVPRQEYAQGLYIATKTPSNKPPRSFPNNEAVRDALRRGEINIDDPIRVGY